MEKRVIKFNLVGAIFVIILIIAIIVGVVMAVVKSKNKNDNPLKSLDIGKKISII